MKKLILIFGLIVSLSVWSCGQVPGIAGMLTPSYSEPVPLAEYEIWGVEYRDPTYSRVFQSIDGGDTYQAYQIGGNGLSSNQLVPTLGIEVKGDVIGVICVSSTTLAVGFYSTDGGNTFHTTSNAESYSQDVEIGDGHIFYSWAGAGSLRKKSIATGTETPVSVLTNIYGFAMTPGEDTIYIARYSADVVEKSTDGGATWTPKSFPNQTWTVDVSDNGRYVFVGTRYDANEVYISSDYGETYTGRSLVSGSSSGPYYALGCSTSGQYVFAGTTGLSFVSQDYGQTFTQVLVGVAGEAGTVGSSPVSNSGKYMIVGDNQSYGTYHISIDYGVTWTTKVIPEVASESIYLRGLVVVENN